jgi:hypothetical protein
MCGGAIRTRPIAQDGHEVCLAGTPCHEIRAIGDDVPVARLGFMLPVSTEDLARYLLTQPTGGYLMASYGGGPPAQWPE